MALHQLVERAATATPDAPALHYRERTVTFGQLWRDVSKVAGAAAELAPPGGRIAMVGPNHPAWVSAYYGVPLGRRILLFLNHRLAGPELGALLERAGASAVIGPAEQLDVLGRGPGAVPAARRIELGQWEALVGAAPPARPATPEPDEASWLLYTSGTTGRPKGAVLTHESLLAAVEVSSVGRPVAPDAVGVLSFPLCHVAGYNVLCHHRAGRPIVLLAGFDPRGFIEAVARWQATTTTLTATMVAALIEELEADPAAGAALRSLTTISYGAAPMPATLLRLLRRHLDVGLSQGYGMTELSGNAVFLGPEEHERGLAGEEHLLRAAGLPGPGVEVRIVDDDLDDTAAGEIGEIVVRGRQVMAGYWDDPEGTASTLVDGWLRTGDLGRQDPEGYLYVVDRKKDVIVTGGENVSSREVEDAVLRCCPDIREAAVVGVPDARWGENVCAVVVAARGSELDPDRVHDVLRGQLAGFKLPRHVVVVEELPKNATGKVQKQELRRWLAEHPEVVGERRG